ncbi:L-lactate dehydrogenase complex protein LldG [Evansella vedderi]|uniref:Lactate utilization protein C n=1 Tax=Evansella vedderi TaxID=38282 RepID=A0ABT9ZSQ7_9BACI|nr:lactate utilization protein C [Evansella vedderi]MDQ0254267.1 L-lactate dehydrogenase complex protein LldG [Evansella vedderi]
MTKGTVQNKDKFLNKIAKRLGRERRNSGVKLPEWAKLPQYEVFKDFSQDELMEQFINHCKNIHTSVKVTKKESLKETFHEAISDLGGKSIVYWNDDRFRYYGLTDALYEARAHHNIDVHCWNPQLGEENVKVAEKANIGITFADISLAESGTVVLFSNADKGRSVSLLPRTYLAIIPKSTLVPRMTQATEKIHKMASDLGRMPSCINFISGPSNSADIELRLVVGVHGPVQAIYIVIEDE